MGHIAIIKNYRLTTAKIYYHLPDYPGVLQTYVWQEFDEAPEYPALHKVPRLLEGFAGGQAALGRGGRCEIGAVRPHAACAAHATSALN